MLKDQRNKQEKDRNLFAQFVYITLLILAIICVLGFIASVVFFIYNQKIIGDACNAAVSCIASSAGQNDVLTEQSIYYLEKIQQIQESTKTNDVMSFIYSAVSSALIGLGVGLIANIYRNSEKVESAAKNAKETMKNYEKSLIALDIQNIHIEIINARTELITLNKERATERFTAIKENSLKFVNKLINYFDPDDEKENLERIYDELCQLTNYIFDFQSYVTDNFTGGKLKSYLAAAENYNAWLDETISYYDKIIK